MNTAEFLRLYWTTLRPYLFFVSGAAGALGLALSNGPAVAFAAFFFSYGFGQAATDVFQTDTDAISSPYRPLTQGLISRRGVFLASMAGLAACGVTLAVLNPWNAALSALAAAGLLAYTPFKRRWWGGPWWNAWIVALLPIMGILCGGTSERTATVAAVASVFFGYAVFVLLGYLKDVTADRRTGYETLPVKAGWRPSILISGTLQAGAAISLMAFFAAHRPSAVGTAVAIAGLLAGIAAHWIAWNDSRESQAHRAIAWSVRGFILLCAGEVLSLQPWLWPGALLFYGAFELVLARRPERTQI